MANPQQPNPFSAASTLTHYNDTYPFIDPSRFANKLHGKTVLVTGGSRGIGRRTVHAFATAGARVVCIARSQGDVDAVAQEVKSQHDGAQALGVAANVKDPQAPDKVLSEIQNHFGPEAHVDILVNAAGMTRYNAFEAEEPSLDSWWNVVEVNLRGSLSFVRAVLPAMRQHGYGVIMNFSSTSASLDVPFNTAYAVSKAGITKFTQDLSVELDGSGVRCYSLHPGSVPTDLGKVEGAVNMEAVAAAPKAMKLFESFQDMEYQTADLAAGTCVAVTVQDGDGRLSGRYIDSERDLEAVLNEARRSQLGKIGKHKLFWLKMEEL